MKNYVDVQTNGLLKQLENEIISLLKQLLNSISDESEKIVERLSLLSGISEERMKEIHSYILGLAVIHEWAEDWDGVRCERESEDEEAPLNLTKQEIHSLCNVINFIASSNQFLSNASVIDQVGEKSSSIIERWIERVNYYYNCSNDFLNKLAQKSNTESFEEFLSTYHIFIDTGALCDENMKTLLNILIPQIKNIQNPLKITVPKAVVDCLQDMAKDAEQNFLFGADEGLRNLKKIQEAGLLSIRGDGADTTTMSTFLSAFSRFKPVYKMMLIAQDETLANAIEMLNTSGVEGAEILICKITESSIVDFWFENELENCENKSIVEESPFDDEAPIEADDEVLKTVSSFQLEESIMDSPDDNIDDNEIETDIEKMSLLEEQLANMLGKNVKREDDSDDELSDDDDFDTEEGSKEDIDFSEDDTLIADAFESDSWSVLD